MQMQKITSLLELYEKITENERLIVDILRDVVRHTLPHHAKEKISFNVPFFYGRKGICIIWPASIPRGGISQGVLLGFWNGYKLQDVDNYLIKGTNKKVFYKIYLTPEEIDINKVARLLKEAAIVDMKDG